MSKAKKHIPSDQYWNGQKYDCFLNKITGNNVLEIPLPVFFHPKLSSTDKLLYGMIYRLITYSEYQHENKKVCVDTNKMLGKHMNLNPQSISNGISKLVNAGFLATEYVSVHEQTFEQIRIIKTTGKEFEHGQTI